MMNWSSGALDATSTEAEEVWRRPTRARALPPGCDRARISRHHDSVERANIHTQLERVGGHDCPDLPFAQLALDLPALAGQISATVPPDCCLRQRPALAGVFQVSHQNFGRKTVIGEHQRLLVALDQFHRDAARLVNVAAADSKLPVDRRIVKNEMLLSGRSAVLIHQLERRFR